MFNDFNIIGTCQYIRKTRSEYVIGDLCALKYYSWTAQVLVSPHNLIAAKFTHSLHGHRKVPYWGQDGAIS